MQPLNQIYLDTDSEGFGIFIHCVNNDIQHLNQLIYQYNTTAEDELRFKILESIYHYKNQMEERYSDFFISACPSYQKEIESDLFAQIQSEFKQFGIHSLLDSARFMGLVVPPPEDRGCELEELIANMQPEKASLLLHLLEKGPAFNIREFAQSYLGWEPDAVRLMDFMRNYAIEFLGGRNCKNFKLTPNDGGRALVLKVTNRMGTPKLAEAHLRKHSLCDTLLPIFVERQVSSVSGGRAITRSIVMTEYCGEGSLEHYGESHRLDPDFIDSALNFYIQMATILNGIQADGCAFPDMKNANWLIHPSGKLKIADAKSFWFTMEDGCIDQKESKSQCYRLLRTKHMMPPEFELQRFFMEKSHAFMLGKNLYEFLSGCGSVYLFGKNDGKDFDFSSPIFQTDEGHELRKLIHALVQPNPDHRMPLSMAWLELQRIQSYSLLKKINLYQLNHDESLSQFLVTASQKIQLAVSSDELLMLQVEVNTVLVEAQQRYASALQQQKYSSGLSFFGNSQNKMEVVSSQPMECAY